MSDADWQMVRLWRLYQGGGMGGVGFLPDPGGVMDQPVAMLDAFALMSGMEAELTKNRDKR